MFLCEGASALQDCERLVRAAQEKDPDAFAGLIAQFERTALAVAYSVTGNAALASDVTQDAFVRAWERLKELKEPARFGGWLCRIVRNFAMDAIRRGPRATETLDANVADRCADSSVTVAEVMQRSETAQQIDAALATLDEVTRCTVVLRYFEDLSSKQIGELLELSPAAVDMRLSRARTQLRATLALVVEER